ncbi:MAG: rhodanese-like domain-containing protein [Egibacteraceae bacterium]
MTVEELLTEARSHLDRVDAHQADELRRSGALLVDIRPHANRAEEGEIPGAVPVERIVLEWRLDPTSDHCLPGLTADTSVVLLCNEGYASSLAARDVQRLGLRATDLIGGFRAWKDAGLPVVPLASE